MAVITYRTDVAPHLQRSLMYRRLRIQRWQALHAHDRDPCGDYDPLAWAERAGIIDLLAGIAALAYFRIADSKLFSRSRSA